MPICTRQRQGPNGRRAAPTHKESNAIDRLTVEQLQKLAGQPRETYSQIGAVLDALSGSEEQAQWASEALENCGTPPSEALRKIAPRMEHPAELVASWACKLVARSGHEGRWIEPLLIKAISTRTEEIVREEAARALGKVGASSTAAREALTAVAQLGGPRLKRLASASLDQLMSSG